MIKGDSICWPCLLAASTGRCVSLHPHPRPPTYRPPTRLLGASAPLPSFVELLSIIDATFDSEGDISAPAPATATPAPLVPLVTLAAPPAQAVASGSAALVDTVNNSSSSANHQPGAFGSFAGPIPTPIGAATSNSFNNHGPNAAAAGGATAALAGKGGKVSRAEASLVLNLLAKALVIEANPGCTTWSQTAAWRVNHNDAAYSLLSSTCGAWGRSHGGCCWLHGGCCWSHAAGGWLHGGWG